MVHVAQYSVLELLTRVAGSWVWFYQWYVCLLYICSFLLSYYKLLYTWVSMFKQFWYNKHVMARWTCVVSSGAIGRIVVIRLFEWLISPCIRVHIWSRAEIWLECHGSQVRFTIKPCIFIVNLLILPFLVHLFIGVFVVYKETNRNRSIWILVP